MSLLLCSRVDPCCTAARHSRSQRTLFEAVSLDSSYIVSRCLLFNVPVSTRKGRVQLCMPGIARKA